jgi:hypothetical protein
MEASEKSWRSSARHSSWLDQDGSGQAPEHVGPGKTPVMSMRRLVSSFIRSSGLVLGASSSVLAGSVDEHIHVVGSLQEHRPDLGELPAGIPLTGSVWPRASRVGPRPSGRDHEITLSAPSALIKSSTFRRPVNVPGPWPSLAASQKPPGRTTSGIAPGGLNEAAPPG